MGNEVSGRSTVEVEAALRLALGERIILPDDPCYDSARLAWNRAADQRPFAVAQPRTEDEVVEVVRAAATSGLRVAAQSTGHGAGALAGIDLSGAVLVSMVNLRAIQVDAAARTATVAGGALWHDVLAASTPHGLTGLHGSAGDVSVVGYTLGGGLSFYGRRHGLAANAVRSVRLVTPAGALITADAVENPDLFWAIRGGSGCFGVVVSLQIDLLAYADVFAGMLLWDASRAAEVAHAWARWTDTAPESATTSLRIMHFPPIDELPPFLRGRAVAVVDGVILEPDATAAALLEPLRALAPEMDTFARIPAADLVHMHMDPPEPSPAATAHAMLDVLPPEAVDALVSSSLAHRPLVAEVRHAGGAFAQRPDHGGALAGIDGAYVLSAVQIVPAPHLAGACTATVHAVVDAMHEWHGTSLAATFIDEPGADPRATFGTSLDRMAAVKRRHDPQDMFAGSHPVI